MLNLRSNLWVLSLLFKINYSKSYVLFTGLSCSFTCDDASKYINEAKTKCVDTCTLKSSDLKSCVSACVTGFLFSPFLFTKHYLLRLWSSWFRCLQIMLHTYRFRELFKMLEHNSVHRVFWRLLSFIWYSSSMHCYLWDYS